MDCRKVENMEKGERTFVYWVIGAVLCLALLIGSCSYGEAVETTKREIEQHKMEVACIQHGSMLLGNGDCIPPR